MIAAEANRLLLERGWLSLMPAEFSAAILAACKWKRFPQRATVYIAGDPPGGIYGVAQGAMAMTSALGNANSPIANLAQAGSWTGLGPLLSGMPRRATMVAMQPLFVAYVPLPALQTMLTARPEWWRHFAQELLIEFDMVCSVANDLLLRSAESRFAATLLRAANCRFQNPRENQPITVPMSQDALAEMTNLSRSSVSPILASFVQRDLIRTVYREIQILNVEGLRQIAEAD